MNKENKNYDLSSSYISEAESDERNEKRFNNRSKALKRLAAISLVAGLAGGYGAAKIQDGLGHSEEPSDASKSISYEVKQNDDLWSIAEKEYPDSDTRDAVQVIESANKGITPDTLQGGESIVIPLDKDGVRHVEVDDPHN